MLEKVGPFIPGTRVRASWLQQMLDALKSLCNIRALYPLKVTVVPGGMLLSMQVVPTSVLMQIVATSGSFPAWSYIGQAITTYTSNVTAQGFANSWNLTGPTITLFNSCEFAGSNGTNNYTYGNGMLITSSSGQINSSACVMQPITVGVVVPVTIVSYDGTGSTNTFGSFFAPNSGD